MLDKLTSSLPLRREVPHLRRSYGPAWRCAPAGLQTGHFDSYGCGGPLATFNHRKVVQPLETGATIIKHGHFWYETHRDPAFFVAFSQTTWCNLKISLSLQDLDTSGPMLCATSYQGYLIDAWPTQLVLLDGPGSMGIIWNHHKNFRKHIGITWNPYE